MNIHVFLGPGLHSSIPSSLCYTAVLETHLPTWRFVTFCLSVPANSPLADLTHVCIFTEALNICGCLW